MPSSLVLSSSFALSPVLSSLSSSMPASPFHAPVQFFVQNRREINTNSTGRPTYSVTVSTPALSIFLLLFIFCYAFCLLWLFGFFLVCFFLMFFFVFCFLFLFCVFFFNFCLSPFFVICLSFSVLISLVLLSLNRAWAGVRKWGRQCCVAI